MMGDTQLLQDHLRGKHATDPDPNCRACRHREPVSTDRPEPVQQNSGSPIPIGTGRKCLCGCGADVSQRARFRPGHDAKLKSYLVKAARQGCRCLASGDAHLDHCLAENARARLEELGWEKFI